MGKDERAGLLRWNELAAVTRHAFCGKLGELYGHGQDDEGVFDSLYVDKQRALLIFMRRFRELNLWDEVIEVLNVYGAGGVGMSFTASPRMFEILRGRRDFTRLLARHRGHTAGFIERNRPRGSLHFLYAEGKTPAWSAHFDLHSPLSPRHAFHHLWREKLRKRGPDW